MVLQVKLFANGKGFFKHTIAMHIVHYFVVWESKACCDTFCNSAFLFFPYIASYYTTVLQLEFSRRATARPNGVHVYVAVKVKAFCRRALNPVILNTDSLTIDKNHGSPYSFCNASNVIAFHVLNLQSSTKPYSDP